MSTRNTAPRKKAKTEPRVRCVTVCPTCADCEHVDALIDPDSAASAIEAAARATLQGTCTCGLAKTAFHIVSNPHTPEGKLYIADHRMAAYRSKVYAQDNKLQAMKQDMEALKPKVTIGEALITILDAVAAARVKAERERHPLERMGGFWPGRY